MLSLCIPTLALPLMPHVYFSVEILLQSSVEWYTSFSAWPVASEKKNKASTVTFGLFGASFTLSASRAFSGWIFGATFFFFFRCAMAHWFLIIETSGLLHFWEEKLNFKFSFIHILRFMHLNVDKRKWKMQDILKYLLKIWSTVCNKHNYVMCII